ncbi:MAG: site-specific integrase [Clostridiales bacterium]|nr:site-specific integrase [Clostridiales bacterium]
MAYFKIETNKKGELVARIQVSTKDIETGKNKLVIKRVHNEKNLTEAKFRKEVEKISIQFEEDTFNAYKERKDNLRNNILTFYELSNEFLNNIEKHLSINYYQRAIYVINKFNKFLEERNLHKNPINTITVRDIQVYLNSFNFYQMNECGLVKLKKDFPKTISLRDLDRQKIINRNTSYEMRKNGRKITKEKAEQICDYLKINFNEYFEEVESKKVYSSETVKGQRRVLRAIFNEAYRYDWITKNPVCATKINAGNSNNSLRQIEGKEVFSVKESQEFLKAIDNLSDEFLNKKIALKLMLLTGVRKGELMGLKWSDVDFKNRILQIRRSRFYSPLCGYKEKLPKTKNSIRDIPIPQSLFKDLEVYYKWYSRFDKNFTDNLENYYLCVLSDGTLIHNQTAAKWLLKLEKDNNLKRVTCHGLRHTYCSLLLTQNVPVQTVANYMGHSDSTITLKVYSHFLPDTEQKVLNVLDSLG